MITKKLLCLATLAGLWIAGASILSAQAGGQPGVPAAPKPAAPALSKPGGQPSPQPSNQPGTQPGGHPVTQQGAEALIRSILDRQVFSWNRGDTEGFLLGYADDTIFVSDKITRGLEEVRVRYQSHYPTRASMGKLTFSEVEIHMIDAANAYVLGHFRLERDAEGGGDTQGVFSLLFKKTLKGWKIVLDHTS